MASYKKVNFTRIDNLKKAQGNISNARSKAFMKAAGILFSHYETKGKSDSLKSDSLKKIQQLLSMVIIETELSLCKRKTP